MRAHWEGWDDLRVADDVYLASDSGPRWRVRVVPASGWRRWIDRTLAQADVVTPGGDRYIVRISRNLPLVRSPLGPFDNLVPPQVSLAVLVAANAYRRGRTGWSVHILRPATAWRTERVLYTERSRVAADVADHAADLADAVCRGEQPWKTEDLLLPFRDRLTRAMNWD